jgi:hypothetical protein
MQWVCHKPSKLPEGNAPDFVLFNKRAATARVTTARDLAYYRKETDSFTPRYGINAKGASRGARPSTTGGFVFGKQVRPSTPIDEVISHRFAEQAEEDLRKFYTEYREEELNASSRVRKIPMTRASRGHAMYAKKYIQHEEELLNEEHFKIRKFKGLPSKVKDGRQEKAHTALLRRLMKDAERCSSAGLPEESELGGSFAGEDPLGAYAIA